MFAFQSVDPGPGEGEKTVAAMAAEYVAAMKGVQPRGPYCIGGWSLGGAIAVEMAALLERQGERLALVALFDAAAPHPALHPHGADDVLLLDRFVRDLASVLGKELPVSVAELRPLDEAGRLRLVHERAQAAGVLPPELALADLGRYADRFRRNFRAMCGHVPSRYSGPLLLLRAAQSRPAVDDPALGWGALTAGVAVHHVPGDHYSMLKKPHVAHLAERLREALSRAAA
jgi:thioesterase domain-containing protein